MNITFRTDASLEIGTGHVMRCITLARALRDVGGKCRFITRDLPGHLGDRIEAEEFEVALLPAPDGQAPEGPPVHAAWAGVSCEQDAQQTRADLSVCAADWLVLDHYAFDARWEHAACPVGTRLMVVDDLADRPHACDLLLDQSLGRKPSDYDGLIPVNTKCLIGPFYALLRPEFSALRVQALADRTDRGLKEVLITMGGVDAFDATSAVLTALRDAPLPQDVTITVVMGGKAPALGRVQTLAVTLPWTTQVVMDVPDMAARMASADLAIGAAGSTTWERCCLGLPSVIVQIADNQSVIARALTTAKAALDPGLLTAPDFAQNLRNALKQAGQNLPTLSQNAAGICDGGGVGRVLTTLSKVDSGWHHCEPVVGGN